MKHVTKIACLLLTILIMLTPLAGCGGAEDSQAPAPGSIGASAASGSGSTPAVGAPAMSLDMKDEAINQEIVDFITQDTKNPDAVLFRYTGMMATFLNGNPVEMGNREFFRSLKERLGDKIKIELYFGAPFGNSADDLIGGMQNRTFEAINYAIASYGEYTSAFFPADTPFLFRDIDDATAKLNSSMGEVMNQRCIDDIDIRILSYCAMGMRHVANSKKEARVPDDLKGMKIRVQNNAAHIALIRSFGAAATPLSYAELYTALQQGLVDGQENPVQNYEDIRLYEVQKYLTMTGHLCTVTALGISNEWFMEQNEEIQSALIECSKAFYTYGVEMSNQTTGAIFDSLLDKGMQIYTPTGEEYAKWAACGRSVWPECAQLCGKDYFLKCLEAAGVEADF